MTSILDKFQRLASGFTAQSPQDLFALRLAQKLEDIRAAEHYVMLASKYSENRLLNAYRHAVRGSPAGELGRRFHLELQRASDHGPGLSCEKLLAIRVERRAIAGALFHGRHLEYTQVRQLSSNREKAVASAVGFITWMLETLVVDSIALEVIAHSQDVQRRTLSDAIAQLCRQRMLPIWEIPKQQIFEGCGYPALKSRKELRQLMATMWPVLTGGKGQVFIRDAIALGLYVQIERLFILN